MVCEKGYMWDPSTCACECDMWCKPGQYLDYENCVCKNKLIDKINSICTSFINESISEAERTKGAIITQPFILDYFR